MAETDETNDVIMMPARAPDVHDRESVEGGKNCDIEKEASPEDSKFLPRRHLQQVQKRNKNGKKEFSDWVSENLGFQPKQLMTWNGLNRILHRPCDPASLAATRIMFGLMMLLDLPQERGMGVADRKWGDPAVCHFPLVHGLQPMPLQWMLLLYAVMFISALMMFVGWRWRFSCGVFVICYWYIFLLDKSSWNNHSYLYGLLSTILLFSDPHRAWSVDSMRVSSLANSHVPLWNYTLLRMQVFLLYFFAGIKKIDADWLWGYSMHRLSEHWVFFPFRFILSNDNIDFYIIHLGGFALDLTIGFFLFFDKTRGIALFFGMVFHLMNSQIFTIGMFPWVCMVTMPIFCKMSWPRLLISSIKNPVKKLLSHFMTLFNSMRSGIIYKCKKMVASKELCLPDKKAGPNERNLRTESNNQAQRGFLLDSTSKARSEKREMESHLKRNPSCSYEENATLTGKQKITTLAVLVYVSIQLFLPFSHFITKGYNTWTAGPYGYSWDMMVHSWDTLHIKITVVKKETREKFYLDPEVWVKNSRWTSHADMAVQFSRCIEERLAQYGLRNFSLHFDVWRSLNRRFQQRIYDPNVDMLEAPWSPWMKAPWVLPMLSDLSSWRNHLHKLQELQAKTSLAADAIFIADFPGMFLENFLSKELSNATLEVLQGEVAVLLEVTTDIDQCLNSATHCSDYPNYVKSNISDICKGSSKIQNINGIEKKTKGSSRHGGNTMSTGTMQNVLYKITLGLGEKITLPINSFHKVITISNKPSIFMYTFINSTLQKIISKSKNSSSGEKSYKPSFISKSLQKNNAESTTDDKDVSEKCQKKLLWFIHADSLHPSPKKETKIRENKETASGKGQQTLVNQEISTHDMTSDLPTWQDFINFFNVKSNIFMRSGELLVRALTSILSGRSMDQV